MQLSLRMKASQQVEQCRLQLDRLQPTVYPALRSVTEQDSVTFTSIDGAPVANAAIQTALLEGVHVIELYGGIAGGLEMLLRNGVPVQKYYYCDKLRPA